VLPFAYSSVLTIPLMHLPWILQVYCKGCWDDEEGCVCQFSLFDWSDPDPTPLECGTDPFMGYLRDPDSPPRSPSVAPRYPTFVINAIDGAVNVVQGPNGSQRSF
jgi:hypothetical protein